MAELTDRQLNGILDSLAELAAQVVGIKNTLTRDQTIAADALAEQIAKARQAILPGWPTSLPDLGERLRLG